VYFGHLMSEGIFSNLRIERYLSIFSLASYFSIVRSNLG